jgi:plasmid stabilization system protein ParE
MTSRIYLVITPRAQRDRREIFQYTLSKWGSGQRDTYDQILENGFDLIRHFPDIGHPVAGRPSNIREYHLEYHIIQYRREPERVVIPHLINPRRRRGRSS